MVLSTARTDRQTDRQTVAAVSGRGRVVLVHQSAVIIHAQYTPAGRPSVASFPLILIYTTTAAGAEAEQDRSATVSFIIDL